MVVRSGRMVGATGALLINRSQSRPDAPKILEIIHSLPLPSSDLLLLRPHAAKYAAEAKTQRGQLEGNHAVDSQLHA